MTDTQSVALTKEDGSALGTFVGMVFCVRSNNAASSYRMASFWFVTKVGNTVHLEEIQPDTTPVSVYPILFASGGEVRVKAYNTTVLQTYRCRLENAN